MPARLNLPVAAVVASVIAFVLAGCATTPGAVPEGLTDDQRAAVVQQKLDETWNRLVDDDWNVEQPTVAIKRFTGWQDVGTTFADCMTAEGYPTSYTLARGIVTADLGDADVIAYTVARYTCQAQYPQDPVELGYLSAAQASYLYNYWSNSLVPCLRSAGVPVAALPAPNMMGEGYPSLGPKWDPYENVDAVRGDGSTRYIINQCPPYPLALSRTT